MSAIGRMGCLIGLLGLLALACNAPIGGNETASPPPPTSSPVETPPTTATDPTPTAETPTSETDPTTQTDPTTAPTETATSLPTFTPIQSTVPPEATATQTAVPTEAVTATPRATATSKANAGPLTFTYSISWQVVSGNPGVAIASVSIVATGGGGDYQYFRDDLPVDGPNFQYEWATCRANPGSLRVTSADGQSMKIDYFEQPPCPSP